MREVDGSASRHPKQDPAKSRERAKQRLTVSIQFVTALAAKSTRIRHLWLKKFFALENAGIRNYLR